MKKNKKNAKNEFERKDKNIIYFGKEKISKLAILEFVLIILIFFAVIVILVNQNSNQIFKSKTCLDINHATEEYKNSVFGKNSLTQNFFSNQSNFRRLKIFSLFFFILNQLINLTLTLSKTVKDGLFGLITFKNKNLSLRLVFIFFFKFWNIAPSLMIMNSIFELYPFFWVKEGYVELGKNKKWCLVLEDSGIHFLQNSILATLFLNFLKFFWIFFGFFLKMNSPQNLKLCDIPSFLFIKNLKQENFSFKKNYDSVRGFRLKTEIQLLEGELELKEENHFFLLKSKKYNFRTVIKKLRQPQNDNLDESINNFFRSLKLMVSKYFS